MTPTKYILSIFLTKLSFVRVLLSSKWFVQFPVKKSNLLHILGNGPSLSSIDFADLKGDLLAVNNFVLSDSFGEVKPNMYIINAPEYWIQDVDDEYKIMREAFIHAIKFKTRWPLHFFLPFGAKNSDFVDQMSSNKHIQFSFYNTTPVEGSPWMCHFLYRKYLGMPRPHNILIPSLMMGIWMEYLTIYLHGADHSWLKEIVVSEDNQVFVTQKHFYDYQTAKPDVMKKLGKGHRKLHEVLEKFYLAFKGYHDIQSFAESRGIVIYNVTQNSFIDAFRRF
ncbi:MAG: hypothetical protein WAT79_12240 [Saprospiraceae bacterium]